MAFGAKKTIGYVSFIDRIRRKTTVEIYLQPVSAGLFVAAADYAAAIATLVGVVLENIAGLSELTVTEVGVRTFYQEQAVALPVTDTALRGNKLVVQFSGSGRNFVFSIPGRDDGVIDYGAESLQAQLTGALAGLQTNFAAVATDINGDPNTVITGAYAND